MTFGSVEELPHLNLEADTAYSHFRRISTLVLANVSAGHVGEYRCQVKRANKSKKVFLFVKDHDHPDSIPSENNTVR